MSEGGKGGGFLKGSRLEAEWKRRGEGWGGETGDGGEGAFGPLLVGCRGRSSCEKSGALFPTPSETQNSRTACKGHITILIYTWSEREY